MRDLPLEERPSSIHGKGSFSTEHLSKGEVLYQRLSFVGFNHSRPPNIRIVGRHKVLILRDIVKDEELTVDYYINRPEPAHIV